MLSAWNMKGEGRNTTTVFHTDLYDKLYKDHSLYKGHLIEQGFLIFKRTEEMLKRTRDDRKVILVVSTESFVPMEQPPSYGDLNPKKEQ